MYRHGWGSAIAKPPTYTAVSAAGLEPATNGLKGHCSTIELRAQQSAFYHGSSTASTELTVERVPRSVLTNDGGLVTINLVSHPKT